MARPDATREYQQRHGDRFARTYFRRFGDCAVSSIGVGTYLGDPTDAADERYREAIVAALEGGCNVVDTAINYRHQRSERVVGAALEAADIDREAVLVATKGGFVPFDGERPADPGATIRSEYVDAGLIDPADLARGQHCIAPAFVDDQLDRSLSNLGVDAVDLYYVHNPETQLTARSRGAVYDQLEETFELLELVVAPAAGSAAARAAGNAATHLRAIQLPFNVYMADAFTVAAHEGADGRQSALWFAHEAGLDVFTSASLMQGRLAEEMPAEVASRVDGETTAQRAINFARSAPGVTSALVGMGTPAHVTENVAAGEFEPLGADAFDAVFE
ncbi:aldo/keto reductase [Halobacteriales archaeon QS_1_68_17]|nr:MAG: aldo/keto reductase [Halobacteriales archaeon QS_1_68_17]